MRFFLLLSFAFAAHAQGFDKILSDDPGQQRLVADGKARLSFLDYDWSLNDSRSSSPR